MKGLRKYSVFAGSLVMAMAIGHIMERSVPDHHPALVAGNWSQAGVADADWLLRSVPPDSVMPLTAEVDPFAFSIREARTEPAVATSLLAPEAPPMPEVVASLALDILPRDRGEQDVGDPIGMLARLDPQPHTSLAPSLPEPGPVEPRSAAQPEIECYRDLVITPEEPAMLRIAVDAPCDAGARVVLRHAGLAVTELLSPYGHLLTDLPAFAEEAEVVLAFPEGDTIKADVRVPDMGNYHRVAIQWQGPDSFQLHAYEFGAQFGGQGHVSAAVPRDPGHALRATGGFMNLLGDSRVNWPLLAEVFTFPASGLPQSGVVRIEIEAMVTVEVCGREMLAETLEIRGGSQATVAELSIQMPGCDALGEFIVLQNVVEDIKVAAN